MGKRKERIMIELGYQEENENSEGRTMTELDYVEENGKKGAYDCICTRIK